jgi:hypothetical protein
MKYSSIIYNGKEFKCREIPDFTDLFNIDYQNTLTIAPEELGELLKDEYGEYGETDREIFFYASPDEMLLSNMEIWQLAV